MSAEPNSQPWRRFIRFSLRGLIVFVLVIGAATAWVVRSARIQREAVAAIRKSRGIVLYDWEWNNGRMTRARKSPGPAWLVDAIGIDYFGNVAEVFVSNAPDDVLMHIGHLRHLQFVVVTKHEVTAGLAHLRGLSIIPVIAFDLNYTAVTDGDLAHLKGLSGTCSIELLDTQITDAGLSNLEGLDNLRVLDLCGTHVTDAGLVHIGGLTNLTQLLLRRTHVTDSGLAHLQRLTNLTELDLAYAQVSDSGLEHLKGMTKLSILRLWRTQVTGAGLEHLKGLNNLTELDLGFTQVSDSGLAHLKGLTKLSSLNLFRTQVTRTGVTELRKALPHSRISD